MNKIDETTKKDLMAFLFSGVDSNLTSPLKKKKEKSNFGKTRDDLRNVDTRLDFNKGTKVCKCCGLEKKLEEFYTMKVSHDGFQYHCIACQKLRLKRQNQD